MSTHAHSVDCPCCYAQLSGDLRHDRQLMRFRQTNHELGWLAGAPFKVCPHCKVVVTLRRDEDGQLTVADSPVYATSRPSPLV